MVRWVEENNIKILIATLQVVQCITVYDGATFSLQFLGSLVQAFDAMAV